VSVKFIVRNIGWVLPASTGCGSEILSRPEWLESDPEANAALLGFSARPYLQSVKGYLDPSSACFLAAASLALGGGGESGAEIRDRAGLSTVTQYGASQSGFRFYEQFLKKGVRFASPLLFPHSYSNTPGNLAAIEFRFGGPHMVFFGASNPIDALMFGCTRLQCGEVDEMLVGAYEAVGAASLPDSEHERVLNGAIVLWLVREDAGGVPVLRLTSEMVWDSVLSALCMVKGSVGALLAWIQQFKEGVQR